MSNRQLLRRPWAPIQSADIEMGEPSPCSRIGSGNYVFGGLGPEMSAVMLAWVVTAVPLFVDVSPRWPRMTAHS